VYVPNADIVSGNITNYSSNDTRRIECEIKITYFVEPEEVYTLLRAAASKCTRLAEGREPVVTITALVDGVFSYVVRIWVPTPVFEAARKELLENIRESLLSDGLASSWQ
jgi:small conductance mechanosensitive channel